MYIQARVEVSESSILEILSVGGSETNILWDGWLRRTTVCRKYCVRVICPLFPADEN